jgi:hypothetical protein
MWVLAFQAFDQFGQLGWNGTRLSAIAARFGSQGGKATTAIAQRRAVRPDILDFVARVVVTPAQIPILLEELSAV